MIDFGQLKGKTIAITGASRGIGKETARLLAGLGANLALGARNTDELDEAASQLDTEVLTLPLDVTDEESVRSFAEEAVSKFKKIDGLINSAGTGVFESLITMAADDFDRMIAVNLTGTFLSCKWFGQHMVRNGAGKMINVVSIAGTTALPGCGGYSASKFGVLGLTRVLQAELRDKGIQVTAVLPGAAATSFWNGIDPKPDMSKMIPVESLAKHLVYLLCQPAGSVVDEITIMPPLGIL
ncbi:3-oxoacyl-ACP reductase [Paenibacillus darwinianus]|uniref:3-oxoacyl-ACP reductase n=1 Tax=Paenibacillus darwinianus TaxID=1380763 RepID=A0A9W5S1L7_9BACL|nr:SDR family oxidoreductase [Paenibacillus darwinianus]EXX89489.1 3-oxoacyl-ACP reductase [Paenibacillus darwinianus]EXX91180.1 3-oxoacyl-ACP reductase [Paenibacillus darwinianus]EXX92526.1 3-oxoacyl-ACP reductase [Paenibacillus darwinianus]